MRKLWEDTAWEDYLFWQANDKKVLRKINSLIKSCERAPFSGIGKPEPLKNELATCWSRRITDEHRLVYKVENDILIIVQCRFHY
ncbi:MAG: Txe/YoeB family addiction module toxin [Mariniphaga sp.]|nr:Txe/YoeB family addiction module toxin [Mariniphaga sp.]